MRGFLDETGVPHPQPSEERHLAALKRYEDVLDALVCAWVATHYANGAATAYGDNTAAIWVPQVVKPCNKALHLSSMVWS